MGHPADWGRTTRFRSLKLLVVLLVRSTVAQLLFVLLGGIRGVEELRSALLFNRVERWIASRHGHLKHIVRRYDRHGHHLGLGTGAVYYYSLIIACLCDIVLLIPQLKLLLLQDM